MNCDVWGEDQCWRQGINNWNSRLIQGRTRRRRGKIRE